MTEQNTGLGIGLLVGAMVIFALQDGISRHLAAHYNVLMVVTIRYWFFAAFVTVLAHRRPGGVPATFRDTRFPLVQILRGLLMVGGTCVAVASFVLLGMVETLAITISSPLLVVALSRPVLGERVTGLQWLAVAIGLAGVLLILRPGSAVFSPAALLPVSGAAIFAAYSLLTRYVARADPPSVSFFWTGIAGGVAMTLIGLWFWQPMQGADWIWMGILCMTGVFGHWLLIRAYAVAQASALQPFTYLHLVFGSVVGVLMFGEAIAANVALGAAVVVAAGLLTLLPGRRAQ